MAAIVACANAVVVPLYGFFYGEPSPAVYAAVSLATLVVIALGSVEVLAKLSLGEAELARLLAGREVRRGTGRDEERRLVNVVDEMAIASGLPAPPLFVLTREPGINAFTAGHSPGSAVVVVTRGALERLSRDELQAVVAHEFSHILNGDVRLNLRAACALQGIVFLAGIGRFMMRYYSGFGTEDTHHILHTLRWGPEGLLYMNQSIYIHSHVETPHGVRRLGGGGIWHFRPETAQLDVTSLSSLTAGNVAATGGYKSDVHEFPLRIASNNQVNRCFNPGRRSGSHARSN